MVLEIEVQGARQIRDAMPEATLVFIAPPSLDALRARLEQRGTDGASEIEQRVGIARQELEAREEFPEAVVNDDLPRAVSELERICADARCGARAHRLH